ncbi:transcription initiation factor TFIID subunit 2 [Geosmithia morbida]|uniref:Transcription initiation factor TFIID subunit 2 n=1 Tax=Geosmithia morbida TaxID=1094350 RepID=A0A9P5D2C9_9HYPO|nr:transcription initiation factor TFIID subunit 2 [Geosmithia morbida]KAF4124908.1 transcription initiation factor TFIID subunit 2 [Geosmithia morbida]
MPGDGESERHPLLAVDGDLPPVEDPPVQEYFVIKQEVTLDINFRDRRIDGTTDIFIGMLNERLDEVSLDAANCKVDTERITVTEVRDVHGDTHEGQKRKAVANYRDPYKSLEHPDNWNWTAEHHDLRRMRARNLFHSRKVDVPAEGREAVGCTPAYSSLKVNLRGKGDQDRPRLIIRKSTNNFESSANSGRKQYKISIPFSRKNPRDGVQFVGVDPLDHRYAHVYSRHSIQPGTASCIFPCLDDHGSRCEWKISFRYPRTLADALEKPASHKTAGKDGSSDKDRSIEMVEEDRLREMTVICSGFLVEEMVDPRDDRKKIMSFEPEKKTSVQKLGFAVGPFEHVDLSAEFRSEEDEIKLGTSALRVHAYCLPRRAEWVRNTCVAMTMAADFFSYTFAKYPFSNFKLCFLEDMAEDTTPLHSVAFASTRLLYPEDVVDTEAEVTRKLVLTLAYQWIGINLIPNTRNDLWLIFGIAHYMTDLFMKRLCGNNEHRFRMKMMSDRLVELDIGRLSLYDLGPNLHLDGSEMDFMNLKSALILFVLDKRLVKASGGHGLTRILARYLTKVQVDSGDSSAILKTEDFKARCEKASRNRLEAFWSQWVYGSGCPRFDVKAKFNKKRLCVELTLNQIQYQTAKKAELEKDDVLRIIKERRAGAPVGPVQPLFTGPMTIRIHEADGTPYEHILEIREDATRLTKFEIPYNTKYKRLKRTRRMKEKHAGAANAEAAGEGAEDALLYCLGDVLQTPDDQRDWELIDWDPETERKMDQESYEWIRVDADFEWAAAMKHTLEPYMYVSQLQQDRDVVAQQDAMLYLAHGPLHPIASGFLVRTLVDRRYFHGIRTMAAEALPRQANIKDLPMLGLRQLLKAYREMFCFDSTNQPQPNDFSNKQQYKVRCAIIRAIAQVRDGGHRCPLEARVFILDQLLYNNNEDNPYSDHHWIALLVEALATSLIPSRKDEWFERQRKVQGEEEDRFLASALDQIERVLRRDEWTDSYQNIWTIAGLDAKQRLMKAEVIPRSYADFGQYLLDGTADAIRIKCFEALIDLGAMTDPAVFSLLLYVLASDRSPYVRSRLIQATARGLAAIAFGEHAQEHAAKKGGAAKEEEADAPGDMDLDMGTGTGTGTGIDADPLLVVQDTEKEVKARKEMFERKENLDVALKALRREMQTTYAADERQYLTAMRKALDHKGLGRADVESLLDLAAMMFEEAQSWVVTLSLPKAWAADRSAQQMPGRLMVNFKSYFRTKPRDPYGAVPAPVTVAPATAPTAPSAATAATAPAAPVVAPAAAPTVAPTVPTVPIGPIGPIGPPAPTAKPAVATGTAAPPLPERPVSLPRAPSIKLKTSRPSLPGGAGTGNPPSAAGTSVARKPSVDVSRPAPPAPGTAVPPAPSSSSAKRPHPDKDGGSSQSAAKRPRTDAASHQQTNGHGSAPPRRRKMVTLKTRPKRLALALGRPWPPHSSSSTSSSSSSSRDGPNRKALPGLFRRDSTPKKEGTPERSGGGFAKESVLAKSMRKPLPSTMSDPARKPLPKIGSAGSGPSTSPTPSHLTGTSGSGGLPKRPSVPKPSTPSAVARKSGSPAAPPTPSAAPGSAAPAARPKIKIVRRSQPGPSQSPPAP